MPNPSHAACPRPHNRIHKVLAHTTRYAFTPQARLADDAGLARSTVSRLVHRRTNPSFLTVLKVTRALERELGRPVDPRDLVSPTLRFPTRTACELVGCPGCQCARRRSPRKRRKAVKPG